MATAISLFGFWAALAMIAFAAIVVWRNTFDRDRGGRISKKACGGFGVLFGGLVSAAGVIVIGAGFPFPFELPGDGPSSRIRILAQHVAESHVLITALTLVLLAWWYALLSVVVVNVLRHRQLRRIGADTRNGDVANGNYQL